MTRRLSSRVLLLAAATLLVAVCAVSSPASAQSNDVSAYLSKINALRASVGAPPLQLDGNLSSLAQGWAGHLADIGSLAHAPDLSAGVTSPWAKLGENVGLGPSTDVVFQAFVNSSAHYANLVDPSFTHVGIGIVWVGGRQYTAHRFMALGASQPQYEEPAPAPRPVARPATVTPVPSEAAATPATTPPTTVPEPAPVLAPPAAPKRVGAIVNAFRAIPT